MHASVYDFVTRVLGREEVEGKRVLEVGALDVNGSVRPYVVSLKPAEYIGIDRRRGRRVDMVVNAEKLLDHFEVGRFDVVICVETLEHILAWRIALWTMLQLTRFGGMLVLTTRSPGFPRHEHPDDHWRFEPGDFVWLARRGNILAMNLDLSAPGMFLAFRPQGVVTMRDLDQIQATRAPVMAP